MQTLPLKYDSYTITFQEVPDETSLTFNITGCPHGCPDCHSKYLWDYHGNDLSANIDTLLDKYQSMITCVLFMGGDQNAPELMALCSRVHERGLKTCLYTGANEVDINLMLRLDYIKLGPFDINRGGLNCETTNQKMLQRDGSEWHDITYKFWQKRK